MVVSANAKPRTPNWTAPATSPASSADESDRVIDASVDDATYSIDFVENGNAWMAQMVPSRDKQFPKMGLSAELVCRRGVIAAPLRRHRGASTERQRSTARAK